MLSVENDMLFTSETCSQALWMSGEVVIKEWNISAIRREEYALFRVWAHRVLYNQQTHTHYSHTHWSVVGDTQKWELGPKLRNICAFVAIQFGKYGRNVWLAVNCSQTLSLGVSHRWGIPLLLWGFHCERFPMFSRGIPEIPHLIVALW